MVSIWESLMKDNFRVIKTPSSLARMLKGGKKSGDFIEGKRFTSFKVVREDSSAWVVSSERGSAGGHYYISKKNPNKAVWD